MNVKENVFFFFRARVQKRNCVTHWCEQRGMNSYYIDESVLLGTKPLVDSIRHFIRDPSGVFSVCHLCECHIVQWHTHTRIIHHNQLLFTKFGTNLRHIESMTSKVEPTENYWTNDFKIFAMLNQWRQKYSRQRLLNCWTRKPGDKVVLHLVSG